MSANLTGHTLDLLNDELDLTQARIKVLLSSGKDIVNDAASVLELENLTAQSHSLIADIEDLMLEY